MSKFKGALHTILLVLAAMLFAVLMFWGYLDQKHYFYHVKTARITSSPWRNHGAKECASWNAKTEQPVLECDGGHSEEQQRLLCDFMATRSGRSSRRRRGYTGLAGRAKKSGSRSAAGWRQSPSASC